MRRSNKKRVLFIFSSKCIINNIIHLKTMYNPQKCMLGRCIRSAADWYEGNLTLISIQISFRQSFLYFQPHTKKTLDSAHTKFVIEMHWHKLNVCFFSLTIQEHMFTSSTSIYFFSVINCVLWCTIN